jgi:hypothetical protein
MLRRVELAPRNLFLRNPCQMRLLYVMQALATYAAKTLIVTTAVSSVETPKSINFLTQFLTDVTETQNSYESHEYVAPSRCPSMTI